MFRFEHHLHAAGRTKDVHPLDLTVTVVCAHGGSGQRSAQRRLRAPSPLGAAMPQQSEAKLLVDLTEVPASWTLATVIDAFLHLAAYYGASSGHAPSDRAREVVGRRLVELWASQPEEAEAWLERCRERFAPAAQATRREKPREALLRHGAADECGKYGYDDWRFSEAGLLRGELLPAAQRESEAAWYLQQSRIRDRCRELAERLVAAESSETARKRQKLEEETSERKRLEAELQNSQEECEQLRIRLAAAEAEVSDKASGMQAAQSESEELAQRAAAAESAAAEMQKELWRVQEEHSQCQVRCKDLANRLEAAEVEHAQAKEAHDAAEKQFEVQRPRGESCSYQARCLPVSAPEGSKAELQIENAVLQERCDQLRQQLAKAERRRWISCKGCGKRSACTRSVFVGRMLRPRTAIAWMVAPPVIFPGIFVPELPATQL